MKSFFRVFKLLTLFVILVDFLCFQLALMMAYSLWMAFPWHGNWQYFSEYSMILWILPPIGIAVFAAVGLYKPEMGVIGVEEQSLIFKATWIIYFAVFAITFFYREVEFSRVATFYSVFISTALVTVERFYFRRYFEWLHRKGLGIRRALIYGAGYHGQRLERWIRQSPKLGVVVEGFLDDEIERLTKVPESPTCLGGLSDLSKWVKKKKIEVVYLAHRKLEENRIVEIIQKCREIGVECWVIPALYRFHVERVIFTNIGGIPLVGFREGFGRKWYFVLKRFLDVGLTLLLAPLAVALGLVIAVGIRLTSRGPIFFKQQRVGYGSKKFTVFKFRTLRKEAKQRDRVSPELRKERQEATAFGAFLRRTGLDEIPQFINVLRGEMSLVGPRPEMPFLVEKYGPLERERLTVKPGITGLWQISEDRKRLLIHENMDYDLYYLDHLGFNLDLAILVKTVMTIFTRIPERRESP